MPRQRTDHRRTVYVLPDDFPNRLKEFQEESGLSRAEIARRIGTSHYTVWRWLECGVIPHFLHQMALLSMAQDVGLSHLLTAWTLPENERGETSDRPARHRG